MYTWPSYGNQFSLESQERVKNCVVFHAVASKAIHSVSPSLDSTGFEQGTKCISRTGRRIVKPPCLAHTSNVPHAAFLCVYMCLGGMYARQRKHMCGGLRTSVGHCFSPSLCVPEIRSLGLCVLLLSELSTGSGTLFERRGS